MSEELAYNYTTVCIILDSRGFSFQEIKDFLTEHQNESGYIRRSLIPNPNR